MRNYLSVLWTYLYSLPVSLCLLAADSKCPMENYMHIPAVVVSYAYLRNKSQFCLPMLKLCIMSATALATDSRFGSFCSLLNGISFKLWHVSVANVQASLHRF